MDELSLKDLKEQIDAFVFDSKASFESLLTLLYERLPDPVLLENKNNSDEADDESCSGLPKFTGKLNNLSDDENNSFPAFNFRKVR